MLSPLRLDDLGLGERILQLCNAGFEHREVALRFEQLEVVALIARTFASIAQSSSEVGALDGSELLELLFQPRHAGWRHDQAVTWRDRPAGDARHDHHLIRTRIEPVHSLGRSTRLDLEGRRAPTAGFFEDPLSFDNRGAGVLYAGFEPTRIPFDHLVALATEKP
jgi:hypothetical protein